MIAKDGVISVVEEQYAQTMGLQRILLAHSKIGTVEPNNKAQNQRYGPASSDDKRFSLHHAPL
jgi:hypothetical protein